jgi:signal transduction histidine kinase
MDSDSLARNGLATANGRRWQAELPAWLVPALAVSIGYYLAARLGFALTLAPHPISTLWPPNALLAAALMLAPTRAWWWLVAAALPGHLAAELLGGVPTAMVLGWYVSNCSEALIAAALVRAFQAAPLRLDSLRNAVLFFVCAVLAAPILSSFIDAALVRIIGWGSSGYWELVLARLPSNMLAELTLGPLVLAWAAIGFKGWRKAAPARHLEAVLLLAGLALVCFVVFDSDIDANASPALYYLPLPFLLWAAMRLGPTGTATAIAVLTVTAIWGAVHGLGPFAGRLPQDMARDLQLFLIAVSVPMLLLTVALEERTRAEHDASEQRTQLKHLSRVAMLGELSGGIAHELNQPLTAILSNAQAAQQFIANKTGTPEMLDEILHDIVLADQRAGEVIRRLRALFKRGETQLGPLEVNTLVGEVLDIVRGDLVTRAVEVEREFAARLPLVNGDRVEMQQVLLNLVVNACEAMTAPSSTAPRQLALRTRLVDGAVEISVEDSGLGFTTEQYQRMFEAFYTTKPQGLGLGLSISRAIIRAHGGQLWGDIRPSGGATFRIRLPALPAAPG